MGTGVTRQAVTKHLHVLGGAGLVRGVDHVWQIEPARLDEVRRWLDHIEGQWDEALGRRPPWSADLSTRMRGTQR